jgi:hypothetical protein
VRRGAVAAIGIALAAAPIGAARIVVYPDGPPPGTTGGFGEPTCVSCHFASARPDSGGALDVGCLPAAYSIGVRYELTIDLVRPGMERAGFELSARFADGPALGLQAGAFQALDPNVTITESGGVAYVHQTRAGATPPEAGRARWRLAWTAPRRADTPVVFHLAANAADGDESPLGDHVYALERTIAPAP